jgi:dihydrofolate reductase
MRKISAGMFISVDGVVEQPNFVFPYFTEEVGALIAEIMDRSDTMLMGRKLYEEWAAYWPGKTAADDPFADIINNRPKLVLSNTLKAADWAGTTILSGDVKSQLQAIKQQEGKDIGMSGSPTTVEWLLSEGLLDELTLLTFPVVVGAGRRMFESTKHLLPLKPVEARKIAGSSVVLLKYVPDSSPPQAADSSIPG